MKDWIFVDIYPPTVAFRVLNTYGLRPFRERVFYHRVAATAWLTVPDIERLAKLAWAADLCDIEKAHYSPNCKTLTLAYHFTDSTGAPGNPHRPHGPSCMLGRSALACDADTVRAGYLRSLGDLLELDVKKRITIECPRSLLDTMPDVVALLARLYDSHERR